MSDTAKGFLLILLLLCIAAFFGSWLTLLSINVLFGTSVPITLETLLACTWLTLTVKGLMTPNTSNSK